MRAFLLFGALAIVISTRATAQASDGKAKYDEYCKKCHGVLGVPPKTMQQKYEKIRFFNGEFAAKVSDDSIVKVLRKGGKTDDMKSFKDQLSSDEMTAVAKYVHELATRVKASGTL